MMASNIPKWAGCLTGTILLMLLAYYIFSVVDVCLCRLAIHGLRLHQAGSLIDPLCIFVIRYRHWLLFSTLFPLQCVFVIHECYTHFRLFRSAATYALRLFRTAEVASETASSAADDSVNDGTDSPPDDTVGDTTGVAAGGEIRGGMTMDGDTTEMHQESVEHQSFWFGRYDSLLRFFASLTNDKNQEIQRLMEKNKALEAELKSHRRDTGLPPQLSPPAVRPTNPTLEAALRNYDTRGNILRVARYRQATEQELIDSNTAAFTHNTDSDKPTLTFVRHGQETQVAFDEVFNGNDTNQTVFESLKPLAAGVQRGHNICIWGDGPSAAGKSFTFTKRADSIVPQFGALLLEMLAEAAQNICLRAYELYKEDIVDLVARAEETLVPSFKIEGIAPLTHTNQKKTGSAKTKAKQWRDNKMVVFSEGTTQSQISEVCIKLEAARTNRDTAMNYTTPGTEVKTNGPGSSSRGHLIVVFTISDSEDVQQEQAGRLVLADFAGSEHPIDNPSPERKAEYEFIKGSKSDFYIALVAALRCQLPVPTSPLGLMLFELFGYVATDLRLAQIMHFHPVDSRLNSYLISDCQELEKAPTKKFQLRPPPNQIRGRSETPVKSQIPTRAK